MGPISLAFGPPALRPVIFDRRERRVLTRLLSAVSHPVEITVWPDGGPDPPAAGADAASTRDAADALTALSELVSLHPALSCTTRAGSTPPGPGPAVVRISTVGADAAAWFCGWPRGYVFSALVQTVAIMGAESPAGRRTRAAGGRVEVFVTASCPHSPLAVRHAWTASGAARRAHDVVVTSLSAGLPRAEGPPLVEVPYTRVAGPESHWAAVGVVPAAVVGRALESC